MWYEGVFAAQGAGTGLTDIWDAHVVENDCWSVYDAAAGANAKVYRCLDPDSAQNCDFFVLVDDNHDGYWLIQLWEGWDAGAHAGVGDHIEVSSSTYTFIGRRYTGSPWALSVLDHRIIFIEKLYWTAQYIGQPRRYDPSYNTPLILSSTGGSNMYNNLALIYNSTQAACRFLFDEAGNQALAQGDGGQQYSSYRQVFGIDGRFHFPNEKVIAGATTGLALGTLEGVYDLGCGGSPHGTNLTRQPTRGQTIEINGIDAMLFSGSYGTTVWSAVLKI